MTLPVFFSRFEWTVAWRYLRARPKHFQAEWASVRVTEMRQKNLGGART